jgi:2-C-methyl-D-erythritol 4-phosphate cytidylyltransferase
VVRVPELAAQVFEVVAGPDERSESVVSVLHKVREAFDADPSADAVRDALSTLRRKGVVEVVYRTVPTYRLAVERDGVTVEVSS